MGDRKILKFPQFSHCGTYFGSKVLSSFITQSVNVPIFSVHCLEKYCNELLWRNFFPKMWEKISVNFTLCHRNGKTCQISGYGNNLRTIRAFWRNSSEIDHGSKSPKRDERQKIEMLEGKEKKLLLFPLNGFFLFEKWNYL